MVLRPSVWRSKKHCINLLRRYRAAHLVPCGGACCFGPPLIPPRGEDPALAASAVDQRPKSP